MKKIKYNQVFYFGIEIEEDPDIEAVDNILVTLECEEDGPAQAKFYFKKIMAQEDEFIDIADSQSQSFYDASRAVFSRDNWLMSHSALKLDTDRDIKIFYILERVESDIALDLSVLQASTSKILQKLNKGFEQDSWACVTYKNLTFFKDDKPVDKDVVGQLLKEIGFRALPKSLTPENQLLLVGGNTLNTNLVHDDNHTYETKNETVEKKKLKH